MIFTKFPNASCLSSTSISCGTLFPLGWRDVSRVGQEKEFFFPCLWASSVMVSPCHTRGSFAYKSLEWRVPYAVFFRVSRAASVKMGDRSPTNLKIVKNAVQVPHFFG